MFLRQPGIAFLALLNVVNAANSCCFVVQEEAHEVYWEEYVTEVHTATVNLTSITTLLTPYPTTTITNYETHVYPITKVLTTTFLVTENPVALYTNPAFELPQKTEILSGSQPTITGGVTVASPIGFWVYHTAKIFAAPPVTDSDGNVACGTVLSFANVASDAPACVPTFTSINSNAAAYFDINSAQGVIISLTTPFVHIPTRTDLQVSPTEVCVQGNGTENYGYPAQELINHLAANPVYRAQYPGIENCLPAGPSIKAAKALAITVSVGADATTDVASTETPTTGGLTSDTTTVVTPTTSITSTSVITSTSSVPASTSTTLVTTTSIPALPESSSSTTAPPTEGETETPIGSGGLIPSTSTPETSTSTVIVSPLPQTELSSSSTESFSSTEISSLSTETSVSTELTSSETSTSSSTSSGSVSTSSSSSIILTSTSTSVSIETTSSSSVVSSSLIVSSSSVTTISTTTSVESTSTSIEELPSVAIIPVTTSSLIVETGSPPSITPTSSPTPTPSPTPLIASSPKHSIPWNLLAGFLGFVVVGIW